jgi:Phytanoyl-CoA dioxygenase (PhyH)
LPFGERVDAVVGPEGVDIGSWYRYWNDVLFTEPFYKLVTSEPFIASLSPILGSEITFQGIGHIRPYLSRPLSHLRWHQDAQFYGHGTESLLWNMVQVWIPLVDVGLRGGCIALVPGSHQWGLLPTIHDATADKKRATSSPQESQTRAVQMERALLRDGSEADIRGLAIDAKADGYEFGGEKVKRPVKRRVVIPGQPAAVP